MLSNFNIHVDLPSKSMDLCIQTGAFVQVYFIGSVRERENIGDMPIMGVCLF